MKAKIEKELDYLLEGNYLINNSDKVQFIGNVLKIFENQNKELIEICTKLIDANQRESVFETIEWTDELENYLLKTNKK